MADSILIKGDPVEIEGVASEAITPGELVEPGGSDDFQSHGSAAGDAQKLFAEERDFIGEDVDDSITSGDTFVVLACRSGDEVHGLLANGENASSIGTPLSSNGAGALQVHTPTSTDEPNSIVGYALETLNNSSGSPSRIKIRVA